MFDVKLNQFLKDRQLHCTDKQEDLVDYYLSVSQPWIVVVATWLLLGCCCEIVKMAA